MTGPPSGPHAGPPSGPHAGPEPDPVQAVADQVISRTIELSEVPAPPLHEQDRAAVVRSWWTADALPEVQLDAAGNVRAQLRPGAPGRPAVLVCAHLDTVFSPEVRHGVTRADGRLAGPGVGDDTIAVSSLSALDALLPPDGRHPVWIVATTGEEGLGNLAGVRALLADPPAPVRALIALEGNYLGRVNLTGVGSVRWQVTITGPGGHAWEEAGQPSAVHVAAGLITRLDALATAAPPEARAAPPEARAAPPEARAAPPEARAAPPEARAAPPQVTAAPPQVTVNVGQITGGESVNSRAQHAEFLLDLRSGDAAALHALHQAATAILHSVPEDVQVTARTIGERPAGALDPAHPLATAAADALREHGISPRLTAASTDANAAYPLGIPALTLGITTGGGTHTEQEWIDIEPVPAGLAALATTIARLDEQEW
jgi:acetylornithine deacetylase/succinyl-diaminopimelate desuccinylase-like protein